ncbi:aminotransferase class V-fold PLP-dependent enzyme [Streptomyces sp. NPDC059957]|uniref:aminotransferase class V-fold PLP-dependent enzyme n=1 Tax=unclassified Streptomyces TaxID=2593676 RepID=UPI003657BC1B
MRTCPSWRGPPSFPQISAKRFTGRARGGRGRAAHRGDPPGRRGSPICSTPPSRSGWGWAPPYNKPSTWAPRRPGVRARARLRGALDSVPGVTTYDQGRERCAIVTCTVAGMPTSAVAAALAGHGISVSTTDALQDQFDTEVCGVHPLVRLSPHYYNTEAEVERAPAVLTGLAAGGLPCGGLRGWSRRWRQQPLRPGGTSPAAAGAHRAGTSSPRSPARRSPSPSCATARGSPRISRRPPRSRRCSAAPSPGGRRQQNG